MPRIPSSVRAWRRSGAVVPPPRSRRRPPPSRAARSGQEPDDVRRGRAEDVGQIGVRQVAQGRPDGPDDGPVRLVGVPAGQAAARRTVIGSRRAPMRPIASSRKRVTPTPAVPPSSIGPGPAVRGVVEAGGEARERLLAPDEPRARVPGRAWRHSTGPRRLGWPCHDRPPGAPAPSRQHAQRAARARSGCTSRSRSSRRPIRRSSGTPRARRTAPTSRPG